MNERITPYSFRKGAPPRIMGTEAEDHVSLPQDPTDLDIQRDHVAIKYLLAPSTFAKADIPVVALKNRRWLGNGQKLYKDTDMFEICTAESLGPKKAFASTMAGIHVVRRLADASELPVRIFRRSATVDNTGSTIRTSAFHMNHIVPESNRRNCRFDTPLETHTATRLFSWQGIVGPEGFELSQKAQDFLTFYNLKDGDSKFFRLEDYAGEQSSPWGTFMSMATTSVLLRVLEHQDERDLNSRFNKLKLTSPSSAIKTVSSDRNMKETIPLKDGRRLTALEIQTELADIAHEFSKRVTLPEDEQYAVEQWNIICQDLKEAAATGDLRPLASRIGWVSKKLWLERKNIGPLNSSNAQAVLYDMSWDCIYPKVGGRLQHPKHTGLTIATDEEIQALVDHPPSDTRASLRGKYIVEDVQSSDPYARITGIGWHYVSTALTSPDPSSRSFHPYQTEEK